MHGSMISLHSHYWRKVTPIQLYICMGPPVQLGLSCSAWPMDQLIVYAEAAKMLLLLSSVRAPSGFIVEQLDLNTPISSQFLPLCFCKWKAREIRYR